MNKVYLIDNTLSGHHKDYLDALMTIEKTVCHQTLKKFSNNKLSVKYYLERFNFIKENMRTIDRGSIVHFLYLDNLYQVPWINLFKKNQLKEVYGTIHHIPQSKLKRFLLKYNSKKITNIITHSEFSKNELEKMGIQNVVVIDYPSFYDYSLLPNTLSIKNELNIPLDKKVITILGGTRYDKGLDIFLDSLNFLKDEVKSKLFIDIAGKEEDIKRELIKTKLNENQISYKLTLDYLSEEELLKHIVVSDLFVLPYRKIFNGNSGPMTEAVVNSIPVLGPNHLNLGFLINEHKLGYLFESEVPSELAGSIEMFLKNNWQPSKKSYEYHKRLSKHNFLDEYKKIYQV